MGGVILLILFILSFIIAAISFAIRIYAIKKEDECFNDETCPSAYFFWIGLILFIVFLSCFLCCTFKIIDAGEVGVEVYFGKAKEETLREGWNKKSPFSKICVYNIRLNEYTMSIAAGEGAKYDSDGVDVRTSDNSLMIVDATVVWSVDPSSAFDIYRKISNNMHNLIEVVIRPNIRSVMRDIGSEYSLDSLMKERTEYGDKVSTRFKKLIKGKGVIIDKVLIRDISPPEDVDRSIQSKLKAEQDLAKKEFEKKMAFEDAEIRRIEAQGIADSQKIIQRELTPIYVQYLAVENYKKLAESPNTTFIIAPTSPDASGMPIILDAQ